MRYKTEGSLGWIARVIKIGLLFSITVAMLFGLPQAFAQTTIYEESFSNGLGSFSGSGRVYTGSYGVRLRGGGSPDAEISSSVIDTRGYTDLTLSYNRATSGLDYYEWFAVSYSVNGGPFTALEANRSASGRAVFRLPQGAAGQGVVLRFLLNASSFFEYVDIDNIVLEGTASGGGDGDGDNGDTGSLPPVDRIDTDGPFQTTQHRSTGPGGNGWVVHPTNLGAEGLRHPIFIWGPGAGTGPAEYDFLLRRIASHGFVVYSEVSTGNGSEMSAALDWIIAQNSNPASRYYQKLDTASIAVGGHSRGSLSAFGIADDPRLTTTVHVAGGSFDGNGPATLRNPTVYIAGENDSLATSNMERDYANTEVPVFFTVMDGVDHIGAARAGMPAIVAWLRWHLGSEDFRRGNFLDLRCDFCTGVYDSVNKNW